MEQAVAPILVATNWQEIRAFLAVVGILFAGGAWIQSLWLNAKLMALEARFGKHVDKTFMPADTLNDKFTQVHKRIDRLQSPPVEDKLESMRLSIAHLTRTLESNG